MGSKADKTYTALVGMDIRPSKLSASPVRVEPGDSFSGITDADAQWMIESGYAVLESEYSGEMPAAGALTVSEVSVPAEMIGLDTDAAPEDVTADDTVSLDDDTKDGE